MVIKINFGSKESAVPDGYTLDFGQAYNKNRGYGWVTQESLTQDIATPLNVIGNGSDREQTEDQLSDTLIHMQYPEFTGNLQAVSTPAAWEYALENGTYQVTLSVGDSGYTDSIHSINLEGISVISQFQPTFEEKFKVITQTIEVTDGRLSIDSNGGTNTKINYIQIATLDEINTSEEEPPTNNQGLFQDVRINFGLEDSQTPKDYIRDYGQAYDQTRGYGWITQDSIGSNTATPLDLTGNVRDRELLPNNLNDTLVHLQFPDFANVPGAVKTPGAWEYNVPNGQYRVTVRVGDAAYTDSRHVINIEGVQAIGGFVPTEDNKFRSATRIVNVEDGKLTLDAIGGENTKLNWVKISSVPNVKINFGLEDTPVSSGYFRDSGFAYSETRGYGWITQDSLGSATPTGLDLSGNVRQRGLVGDFRQDSLLHMQFPEFANVDDAEKTPGAWEYNVPNGTYEVKVSVGDARYTDSNHVINVEGVATISNFVPTENELFKLGSQTVEVTDGKLTIDAIGGINTKINYVEITTLDTEALSFEDI